MIYFYHHYELPYVVQQNQLQQVLIQRQQDQHHHHQFANGAGRGGGRGGAGGGGGGGAGRAGGGDGRRGPDTRSPAERAAHRRNNAFSIMNGLQHLARLRATLLRRRRVRPFDAAGPQPPPTPQVIPDGTIPNAAASPVDVSGGGGDGGAARQDGAVPVVQP